MADLSGGRPPTPDMCHSAPDRTLATGLEAFAPFVLPPASVRNGRNVQVVVLGALGTAVLSEARLGAGEARRGGGRYNGTAARIDAGKGPSRPAQSMSVLPHPEEVPQIVLNVTDPTYPTFPSNAPEWGKSPNADKAGQMPQTGQTGQSGQSGRGGGNIPNRPDSEIDRRIAIFGPLARLLDESQGCKMESRPHSQPKGDILENRCNCTMEFQTTINDNHDDNCSLWQERTFWDGDDMWDADRQCLVIAPMGTNRSTEIEFPYPSNPYENAEDYLWDGDTPVVLKSTASARTPREGTRAPETCDQEDEAVAAMIDGCEQDEYGWVQLPDGSWADMENRVTYRAIKDDDGKECWVEELWDDPTIDYRTGEVAACTCQPEKTYWCTPCGVTRDGKELAWRFQTPADKVDYDNGWDAYSANTCTHAMDEIALGGAENVVVYASKNRKHTADTTPDLGCYAYNGWNPASPAIFIPWQDYGLPTCSYTSAARSIKQAFQAAADGQVVEVGCMGGHGRTGTILACMAVLADPSLSGNDAVKLIRSRHCTKAVETGSQEWFVRWFAAWARGELFTELEPKSSWTSTSTAKVTSTTIDTATGKTTTTYANGSTVTVYGGSDDLSPKGGAVTNHPDGKWCATCRRSVFQWHNTECPFNQDNADVEAALAPERPDGNTAPGATANARRRAEKRQRRAEAAKRSKARRQDTYRNAPVGAR